MADTEALEERIRALEKTVSDLREEISHGHRSLLEALNQRDELMRRLALRDADSLRWRAVLAHVTALADTIT